MPDETSTVAVDPTGERFALGAHTASSAFGPFCRSETGATEVVTRVLPAQVLLEPAVAL